MEVFGVWIMEKNISETTNKWKDGGVIDTNCQSWWRKCDGLVLVEWKICTGWTRIKEGYHSIVQRQALPCGQHLIGADHLPTAQWPKALLQMTQNLLREEAVSWIKAKFEALNCYFKQKSLFLTRSVFWIYFLMLWHWLQACLGKSWTHWSLASV